MLTIILHGVESTEESDGQILLRVEDHLNSFMNTPVQAIRRAQRFLKVGGFPSLEAKDRDFVTKWLWMELHLYVYYGLEDGSFLLYNEPKFSLPPRHALFSREPGFSGYATDPVPDQSIKHWMSCVDHEGNPRNCTLPEGYPYVKCIDDCKMTKCDVPQEDCELLIDSEERSACEQRIVWCEQYSIETVQPGEKLGSVPSVNLCVNEYGDPEQTPGKVALDPFDEPEFGNCYYLDDVTLVNSTLEGDFAYCGGEGECNPYTGAYSTQEYDPRYRPWYITSKARQSAWWSDPYIFFSHSSVGMSYTEPMYAVEGGKKVFKGVFAVDYTLEDIRLFLLQFQESTFMVLIVEAAEPNYVVATSTGSTATILVNKDNPTTPCSNDSMFMDCDIVRNDINRLGENADDLILRRAFEAQASANFPNSTLVPFKRTDELRDEAFFSQGGIFQQPNANLEWRIIVAMPMTQSSVDAAYVGTVPFYIILTVSLVGFMICFSLFYTLLKLRKHRAIQNADWRFTCAFLFGCSLFNLSSLSLLGENRDGLCMLRMWLINLMFASALSPLFVKVWRMYKLLRASSQFRRVSVTNFKAMLYTLPIIMAEVVILVIFSIVDPRQAVEDLGASVVEFGQMQSVTCQHKTSAFFATQASFHAFLVLIGCYLAYETRNLDARFGEAKQLGFAMYNTAFTGIVLTLISGLVDMDPAIQLVLVAVGVAWGSIFNSAAFVVPRIIQLRRHKRKLNRTKSVHSNKRFVMQGNEEVLVDASSHQLSVPREETKTCSSVSNVSLPETTGHGHNEINKPGGDSNEESKESCKKPRARESAVRWLDEQELCADPFEEIFEEDESFTEDDLGNEDKQNSEVEQTNGGDVPDFDEDNGRGEVIHS